MTNAKAKIITEWNLNQFSKTLNDFLKTIDVRQIIKTEYSTSMSTSSTVYSAVIYYVDFEDIRDIKLDNVLNIK